MARQVQRMVTRAAVTRLYIDLRESADRAAKTANEERQYEDGEVDFHTGRHAGLLTALNMVSEMLAQED